MPAKLAWGHCSKKMCRIKRAFALGEVDTGGVSVAAKVLGLASCFAG